MRHEPKFSNYEDFTEWLDSISPIDDHGFHVRQHDYWNDEPVELEVERLEFNLAAYREYLKNGSKFPPEVHQQRMADLKRLRDIRQ